MWPDVWSEGLIGARTLYPPRCLKAGALILASEGSSSQLLMMHEHFDLTTMAGLFYKTCLCKRHRTQNNKRSIDSYNYQCSIEAEAHERQQGIHPEP